MFRGILLALLMVCYSPVRGFSLEKSNISNGKKTTIKSIPYQAAIEFKKEQDCGASIIGNNVLLTAAHCFALSSDPKHYQVRVGSTNRESGGTVFEVRDFVKHNANALLNAEFLIYAFDIAVLWIRGRFTFGETVRAIALPKIDCDIAGAEGIVTGWGMTEKNPNPNELRFAKVRVLEQSKCKKILGRKVGIEMFCAGQYTDGRGACKGDSGGPLVIGKKLCGIVSWGEECGIPGLPEVYTKVTFFLEWIKLVLDIGPRRR